MILLRRSDVFSKSHSDELICLSFFIVIAPEKSVKRHSYVEIRCVIILRIFFHFCFGAMSKMSKTAESFDTEQLIDNLSPFHFEQDGTCYVEIYRKPPRTHSCRKSRIPYSRYSSRYLIITFIIFLFTVLCHYKVHPLYN